MVNHLKLNLYKIQYNKHIEIRRDHIKFFVHSNKKTENPNYLPSYLNF